MDDLAYRKWLKYKIAINTSNGTYSDLMNAIQMLLGHTRVGYSEKPESPATVIFNISNLYYEDILAMGLLKKIKAAGVRLDFNNTGILFDFGGIVFYFPLRSQFRCEYRTGRAVWSLLPSFDRTAADAMPLDWRPWTGVLQQHFQAVSRGYFTGVSHLDRLLSFDRIHADFLPLDTSMPYTEAAEPPIIIPLLHRNLRSAGVSIRGPTGYVSSQRCQFFLTSRFTGSGEIAQKRTANASIPEKPSHADDYLTFDSVPADMVPLDKPLPHREGISAWR
jgi:hypothetical protein